MTSANRSDLTVAIHVLASAICVILMTKPCASQCVAQDLPKLTKDEYLKRAATSANNATFASFVTGQVPNSFGHNAWAPTIWKMIEAQVEPTITRYYQDTYTPRDVVCIALTEDEYSAMSNVLPYGGTKLVLSRIKHPDHATHNGLFGNDLKLLRDAYKTVMEQVTLLQKRFVFCHPGPGGPPYPICNQSSKYLQELRAKLTDIDKNFALETANYAEYGALSDGSTTDSVSLTAFYDRVASLSYLNSMLDSYHPIPKRRDNQTFTIRASFYDPLSPELVPAISLLDFVERHFIRELTTYYFSTFDLLAKDPVWTPALVQTKSLRVSSTLKGIGGNALVGAGVSHVLCREQTDSAINYKDLLSPDRQQFLQSHIGSFCKFAQLSNKRVLNAADILKTQNTFPLQLTLVATERLDNDISTSLQNLSTIQIDQSGLLNDIKRFVGNQYYDTKIASLQSAIAAAEDRVNNHGLAGILKTVASGASGLVGLTNLATGFSSVTELVGAMSSSNDGIGFLQKNQDKFNVSADQLSKGAAAIGTLEAAITSLGSANKDQEELDKLRAELQDVQNQLQAFQSELAATVNFHKQQYTDAYADFVRLREERDRIFLSTETSLNVAVIKELLGARLAHVNQAAALECPLSASLFIQSPSNTLISSLNQSCTKYSDQVRDFVSCLQTSPISQGSSELFASSTGLIVAEDHRAAACFPHP